MLTCIGVILLTQFVLYGAIGVWAMFIGFGIMIAIPVLAVAAVAGLVMLAHSHPDPEGGVATALMWAFVVASLGGLTAFGFWPRSSDA